VLLDEAYRNHLFVSPSVTAEDGDTEGGAPVTVIELAASGMPVVSSLHCDIPEVLQDGVTGLLAQEKDVAGIESKLNWLLDNPEIWETMVSVAPCLLSMSAKRVKFGKPASARAGQGVTAARRRPVTARYS